jgi:uncharacterized protein (TIGR03437 family)
MTHRTTRYLSLFACLCSATLIEGGLRAQSYPPEVASANNSADYSTTIAQGSLFVVFGYYLGPTNLVQVSSLPLPNALSGTSVTVQSGSTVLNCPMVYTSFGQVAAILPSSVPAGPATITVAYGGTPVQWVSSTSITVAPSSFGIFTTTSRGFGAGSITALDGTLKTFTTSAKPADVVILWGTGLGPVGGPDNALPTSYPSFPNVQVWVGGQSAPITYAGRSGCCVGVDQIAFTVPAAANGCNVPVTVVSGGVSSNTVSLAVSSTGGACTDSGPTPPAPALTKAVGGQPVKVAAIGIGPAAMGNIAANSQAVARQLSAALHTQVSEADASRLISAYADGNSRAIRAAMTKYASRWKALDRPTRARIIARLAQAQQGALAFFDSFGNEAVAAALGSAEMPGAGACVVLPPNYPSGLEVARTGLDAGASLLLTGAAGSFALKQSPQGEYHALFGSSMTGASIPLGAYTISGTGGKDVGAFSASITVGSHLAISNKASLATVDRTKPLVVNWTGGAAGSYVAIGGHSPASYSAAGWAAGAIFTCVEDGGKGTFTIPSYILSSMNATDPARGLLVISHHPLSNQIAIPGIDLAYFVDGSSDSVNITFQ